MWHSEFLNHLCAPPANPNFAMPENLSALLLYSYMRQTLTLNPAYLQASSWATDVCAAGAGGLSTSRTPRRLPTRGRFRGPTQ